MPENVKVEKIITCVVMDMELEVEKKTGDQVSFNFFTCSEDICVFFPLHQHTRMYIFFMQVFFEPRRKILIT